MFDMNTAGFLFIQICFNYVQKICIDNRDNHKSIQLNDIRITVEALLTLASKVSK